MMGKDKRQKIAPFISVIILVLLTLGSVILKMENVRMNYEVLKLRHMTKIAKDDQAHLQLTYGKLIRPDRLNKIGIQRLALAKAQKDQVVLMASSGRMALRH